MKFTVITINYNNVEGLRATFDSVFSQTCHDYQYVVIDGGSTDGSKELIEQNADKIDYWVSEKDKGIYNAMNKGVAVATGEYCIFMNSGDCFYDGNVLDSIALELYGEDILVGNVYQPDRKTRMSPPPTREISLYHLYSGAIPHQGAFIKTSLLRKYPYDETMKIAADWKFFIQVIILNKCSFRYVDLNVSVYDTAGISATHSDEMYEEKQRYLSEILPERVLLDYKYMKASECLVNSIAPQIKPYYRIDRVLYTLGTFLLKITKKKK